MIRNYLKIAWRNIKRQPFFSSLNMIGLAVGMAGSLLIGLYIYDELSFDQVFVDSNRIYRVDLDMKMGDDGNTYAVVPAPMGYTLQQDLEQVELSTRFRTMGPMMFKADRASSSIKESGITYVDSSFFQMFGLSLVQGNPLNALKEPNTMVITERVARKHFKEGDALGKSITLDDFQVYKVTGVIPDMPKNSFLRDHTVFLSMQSNENSTSQSWGSLNYQTFIKILPGVNPENLQKPIDNLVIKYVIPWAQNVFPGLTMESCKAAGNRMQYSLMPITDIHLNSSKVGEMSVNSSLQNIYILFFIALFLLVLAIVNYMNLSTAQSLKRAKEVGIRKTLGAEKSTLIPQFLFESGLISFISLLAAILLATSAIAYFNQLADKSLTIPFGNPKFWMLLLGFTLLLGLLAGSYPAFFLSKYAPIKVLKGNGSNKETGGKIRNALVVFQFAISIFLIICTLVVFQQLNFIKNKDVGFQKEQILVVNDTYLLGNQINSFKEEILKLGQTNTATISSFLPTPSPRNTKYFAKKGDNNQENTFIVHNWGVDYDYANTLNLELKAGRFFDESFATDSSAIVINESTAKLLGATPESALGLEITTQLGNPEGKYYKIIGVLKNFNFESLRENVAGLAMRLRPENGSVAVELKPGDFSKSISQIENIWTKMAPGQPFSYYFLEDSFNDAYRSEQKLGSIFLTFTILSLIIAGLGLFGLAAFNAEKRKKEIGIRKVMGASIGQVAYRLTSDFIKLVGVAVLISLPTGWWAMHKWLQDFSFRTEISWWILIVSAVLALAISILTVSFQAIKAAMANPVKSLRSE